MFLICVSKSTISLICSKNQGSIFDKLYILFKSIFFLIASATSNILFGIVSLSFFSIYSECEADPSNKKKIIILGGGPNRIGQGIEFDYCCCQASFSLKDAGFETIMVNCNPETVSTDYDTSDRLYFEPLKEEYVFNIIKKEQEKGCLLYTSDAADE